MASGGRVGPQVEVGGGGGHEAIVLFPFDDADEAEVFEGGEDVADAAAREAGFEGDQGVWDLAAWRARGVGFGVGEECEADGKGAAAGGGVRG